MGSLSGTNGKSKKAAGSAKPNFRFLNYDLTVDDKQALAEADLAVEFPFDEVMSDVDEGFKFSLSLDEKNSSYVAAFTDRRVGSAFENVCVTGRGATAMDAWYSLAYRHKVVGADGWEALEAASKPAGGRFG